MSSPDKYIIVAMTKSRVIGKDNRMPWHMPEDLRLFKKLTTGNTVIMGRKTFESIGKPLPNRNNIVVTRSDCAFAGTVVCHSLEEALNKAEGYGKKIFFIGGAQLYREAIGLAGYMYISWLKNEYTGDAFFPQFNENEWEKVEAADYPDFINILYKRIKTDG